MLLARSAETSHTAEGPSRALDISLQITPALLFLCGFGKLLLSWKRPSCWVTIHSGKCQQKTLAVLFEGSSLGDAWQKHRSDHATRARAHQGNRVIPAPAERGPNRVPTTTCSLTAPVIPVFHFSSKAGRRWITYFGWGFSYHVKTLISHLRSASALQPNTMYLQHLLFALSPSGRCNSF